MSTREQRENFFACYIRQEHRATIELFKKICEREGKSQGEKLIELIAPYLAVHGDGNPQTILDFAGEVKTLPRWKTCKRSDKYLRKGEFVCNYYLRYLNPTWRPPKACEKCSDYDSG